LLEEADFGRGRAFPNVRLAEGQAQEERNPEQRAGGVDLEMRVLSEQVFHLTGVEFVNLLLPDAHPPGVDCVPVFLTAADGQVCRVGQQVERFDQLCLAGVTGDDHLVQAIHDEHDVLAVRFGQRL
jgi:hypothetical protein